LDPQGSDFESLRALIADLTRRVYELERALETRGIASPEPSGKPVPSAPLPYAQRTNAPLAPLPPLPRIPPRVSTTLEPAPPDRDLESRIGSQWLNRIGITAVLIGISYFLKFAFDNNWIGPAGRVAIGLIAGIALVLWSERFRSKGYKAFSYSLKAVGIGAMYLSLWAAFQVYALIPSGIAFIAMMAVTAATGVLAVTQNAEILAAFALSGGFLTPVLVSTGQNREFELFSYLILLDVAALALVVFKPWQRLLVLSFVGTLSLYVGWYSHFYDNTQVRLTLGFATLFFAIFAVAPLVARRREAAHAEDSLPAKFSKGSDSPIALMLAFVNAVVYFLQVYALYESIDKTLTAWFALGLAAVYILLSRRAGVRYDQSSNSPFACFTSPSPSASLRSPFPSAWMGTGSRSAGLSKPECCFGWPTVSTPTCSTYSLSAPSASVWCASWSTTISARTLCYSTRDSSPISLPSLCWAQSFGTATSVATTRDETRCTSPLSPLMSLPSSRSPTKFTTIFRGKWITACAAMQTIQRLTPMPELSQLLATLRSPLFG